MRRDQVGAPRVSGRAGAEGVRRVLVVGCGQWPPATLPPTLTVVSDQLFVLCGQLHSIALAMTQILGRVSERGQVVEGARAAEVRQRRGRGCLRGLRNARDAEE